MKVRYSPVISQASGAAGPVVASRWKGINYFRERIVPANPKSDHQVAVRALLTITVAWFHDLELQVTDDLDRLTSGTSESGFNAFCKRNIADLYTWLTTTKQPNPTDQPPRIMPLNANVNPIVNAAGVAGASTKTITLTWDQGEAVSGDKIYVLAGESVDGEHPPANLFVQSKDAVLVETETATLTMPMAATAYMLAVLVENVPTSRFSIANTCWATSKA